MVQSAKRNSKIWGVFCIIGLCINITYMNNFGILNSLNLKDIGYAILTACIIILPYIYCEKDKGFRIMIYTVSFSFHTLLILDYLYELYPIKYIIILGFTVLICFIALKYKNALPILIIDKQKLKCEASTKLLPLLNYNLFANSICIIGITGLLWNTQLNSFIIFSIILILSVLFTFLRQIYSLRFYEKQKKIFILENVFLIVFITITSIATVFSRNNDKGFLQTFLYVIVLMTAYLVFDRPYLLKKLKSYEEIETKDFKDDR